MITLSWAKPATAPLSHMITMSGGAPPATAAAISSVLMLPLMPLTWMSGFAAFQPDHLLHGLDFAFAAPAIAKGEGDGGGCRGRAAS